MRAVKLNGLDHLRALAITMVFLFHYQLPIFGHPQWLKDIAKFGWTGVDLFFVLSGYLIAFQLFHPLKTDHPPSLKVFFIKRAFRILPVFWFTLLLYFCCPPFHERESLPPLWKFLTFTQNFGLNIKDHGTFSHAWSLCVEEHFYFLLPLLLITLFHLKLLDHGWWMLILLFVGGFFVRYHNWDLYQSLVDTENSWSYWYEYVYYPSYNRLDGLLVGVGIAALQQFLPQRFANIQKRGNWLILCGILVLSIAYFMCYEERSFIATVYGFPTVAIGYGFLVAGAISPNSILYRSNSRITSLIATLSFSIYLTHKGIVHITQHILSSQKIDIDNNLTLAVSALACVLAAIALNFLIEKPFLKLRQKTLYALNVKHE